MGTRVFSVWFSGMIGALLIGSNVSSTQAAVTLLRLDATIGVEEAPADPAEDGDAVSRWLDQGGMGNNAVVSSFGGSTSATYSTNDHLGSPAVVFDATTDRYRVSTLGLSSTSNYYISATIKGSGSGERVILETFGFGAGNGMEFMVFNKSLQFYGNGFNLNTASSPNPSLRFLTDDVWTDVALEKDGNLYRLFINGQVSITGTSGVAWSGFPYLTIGSGSDHSTAVFGSIASLSITAIPEPTVLAVCALGMMLVWRRRSHIRTR